MMKKFSRLPGSKPSSARLRGALAAACLGLCAALAGPSAFAMDQINVPIDQVVAFKLDKPADSIYIGNPAIANVHSLTKEQFHITGLASGTTNFMALDADGKEISNVLIRVSPPSTQRVILHKATAQSTYTCLSSSCELTPMIGDDPGVFDSLQSQSQSKMKAVSAAKGATAGE